MPITFTLIPAGYEPTVLSESSSLLLLLQRVKRSAISEQDRITQLNHSFYTQNISKFIQQCIRKCNQLKD